MTDIDDKILRIRAVIERTGCPRASIYRSIKNGTFPKPVRIGPRAVGWQASRIAQWISDPAGYQDD